MKENIDKIINNFDFEKVHEVMNFLGWEWHPLNKVPSIDELKKQARELLEQICAEPDIHNISTGGFEVILHRDILTLKFVIEECFITYKIAGESK